MRRTTLAYFNPNEINKAKVLARHYKQRGIEVVIEKNKILKTIDVMKINKSKRRIARPKSFWGW